MVIQNRQRFFLFFILGLVLAVSGSGYAEPAPGKRQVYVIPVSGDVDPGMAAFIKRAFRDAPADEDALYVLEMDTFGGRVDSALQIVDTLLKAPEGKTIAYVENKAISAGALIALACNKLVMRPNTTIGDCAPITYSEEGPKMMGEKFQSPLRAKFRTLARRNGFPQTLAESMVTADMVVYEVRIDGKIRYLDAQELEDLTPAEKKKITSKRTVVAEGELLTMDDEEARKLGFSRMSAANIEEMLAAMKIDNYEIVRFEENWSEISGSFIGVLSPILLMIGLGMLYTELKAPGFGVPGIVGIICLGLVFFNQYLVGLADYTELLLIVIGLILLGIEFFVLPGFGIAGVAGFLCIGIGMVLSFQDFVIPDPAFPWQEELLINNMIRVLGSFLAAFIVSLTFIRYALPRMSTMVEGPYLAATLAESHADSEEAKRVRVGDAGVALTFLRPAGKVRIGDEIIDAITEGDFMEKDTPVTVAEIKGNRVIVARREQ